MKALHLLKDFYCTMSKKPTSESTFFLLFIIPIFCVYLVCIKLLKIYFVQLPFSIQLSILFYLKQCGEKKSLLYSLIDMSGFLKKKHILNGISRQIFLISRSAATLQFSEIIVYLSILRDEYKFNRQRFSISRSAATQQLIQLFSTFKYRLNKS